MAFEDELEANDQADDQDMNDGQEEGAALEAADRAAPLAAAGKGPKRGGCLKGCGCAAALCLAFAVAAILWATASAPLPPGEKFFQSGYAAVTVVTLDERDDGAKALSQTLDRLWRESASKDPKTPQILKDVSIRKFMPLRGVILTAGASTPSDDQPLVVLSLSGYPRIARLLFGLACIAARNDKSDKAEVRTRAGRSILIARTPDEAVKTALAMIDNSIIVSRDPKRVEAALDRLGSSSASSCPLASLSVRSKIDEGQDAYGLICNEDKWLDRTLARLFKNAPAAYRPLPGEVKEIGWDGDLKPDDTLALRVFAVCADSAAARRAELAARKLMEEMTKKNHRVKLLSVRREGTQVIVEATVSGVSELVKSMR